MDLLTLRAGDIFCVNNVWYIALEHFKDNKTAIIRKDVLENLIVFDSGTNNWRTSSIRRRLNEDYLKEIETAFGKHRIVEHEVDLLSDDEVYSYGKTTDKISLLTSDRYLKYMDLINDVEKGWWLVTPASDMGNPWSVRCVGRNGWLFNHYFNKKAAVRPFFIVQS